MMDGACFNTINNADQAAKAIRKVTPWRLIIFSNQLKS